MGRMSDSGLAHGAAPLSQERLEQLEYYADAQEAEDRLSREAMVDEALLDELERMGVKFSREDVVFVTRDQTGQIVWLETGNRGAGLEHILVLWK